MPADDERSNRATPGNQTTIAGDVHGPVLSGTFTGPVTLAPGLSANDRDTRRRMLKQVRSFWVEGVLDQSLYRELLIALNLETDPRAVSFTGPRLATRHAQEAQPLPAGTTIAQVYQAASQRLLVLGAPGAGKTTLLLDLARSLLLAAEQDETRPIPVVFNLSSWAQQRPPLERWLVQELRDQYGVGRRYAQQWLKQNAILPLLDGLDEVAEPQRAACVAAINTFIQEHGSEGIVVCSRIADYQAIGSLLVLDAAVQVQPLDDAQIARYLAWAGEPLAGVGAVLAQDDELRELARAPLILNILALAYQGQHPEELVGLAGAEKRRQLFDAYVQRMFDRPARSDPKRYTREQTLRWLRWLARSLVNDNQTVFQIELMQPWWLRHLWERGLYLLSMIGGMLMSTVILGMLFGSFSGVLLALVSPSFSFALPDQTKNSNAIQIFIAAISGVLVVSILGLIAGICFSFIRIRPTESLRWSWHTLRTRWLRGVLVWLLTGPFVASIFLGTTPQGTLFGLFLSVILGGLLAGLVAGLSRALIQTKANPNQGTWRSFWRAVAVYLVGGLVVGLLIALAFGARTTSTDVQSGLTFGLIGGGLLWLYVGGHAFVQHFALRVVCALRGYAPWNYPRFLNYAVERILLRRVGGSYIFVHRMLLEYFAEQEGAHPS